MACRSLLLHRTPASPALLLAAYCVPKRGAKVGDCVGGARPRDSDRDSDRERPARMAGRLASCPNRKAFVPDLRPSGPLPHSKPRIGSAEDRTAAKQHRLCSTQCAIRPSPTAVSDSNTLGNTRDILVNHSGNPTSLSRGRNGVQSVGSRCTTGSAHSCRPSYTADHASAHCCQAILPISWSALSLVSS